MNLLIDSKLCVTPHRITIDFLPDQAGQVRELTVVCDGDEAIAVRPRRRSARWAYRAAPAIDAAEVAAPTQTGLLRVDVATPFGVRRDFRLDGETLYSEYVAKSAA